MDYAPGGMPDFDQKQLMWYVSGPLGDIWTHSGPAAVANSLWWFDSRFEAAAKAPPLVSDSYRMIRTYYPTLDDHNYPNTSELIADWPIIIYTRTNLCLAPRSTDLFEGSARLLETCRFD